MGKRLAAYTILAFVILGGTSFAAVKLGKGSVKRKHVAKHAITSPKVKDGSLLAKDFKAGQLPAGPKGDAGPAGPPGPKGETGPATGVAGGDLAGTYPNPTLKPPLALAGTLTAPFLKITGETDTGVGAGPQDALLSVSQLSTNGTGPSIYGETHSSFANFGTAGLVGVAAGTGGTGVLALADHAAGTASALSAVSDGNGSGVRAHSAKGHGVEATTGDAADAGVYGWAPNYVTGGTGVRAAAFGPNGVGLRAQATGAGGKAAILTGNVDVTGTLTKPAGSFKIDHPADPANKYLSHSFVESPDMKNIYDGVVTTGANGFATVTMPGWFDALNRDFRYQLTVHGRSFARAIVWEELQGRRFTIRSDEPRTQVSWQVTGIRQDAFANANRIAVEQDKTGGERGRYLTPELFGRPESEAIGR